MKETNSLKITLSLVGLGAAARLLPHPPNVTPMTAMALLGGAYLTPALALIAPLLALFAGDLFLGLHATMPFVYGAFLITALMGRSLAGRRGNSRLMGACVASSLTFFALTNFGVWCAGGLYPRTMQGLMACYAAALPFLRNSLLGDLTYTALLFGLERAWLVRLAQPAAVA